MRIELKNKVEAYREIKKFIRILEEMKNDIKNEYSELKYEYCFNETCGYKQKEETVSNLTKLQEEYNEINTLIRQLESKAEIISDQISSESRINMKIDHEATLPIGHSRG